MYNIDIGSVAIAVLPREVGAINDLIIDELVLVELYINDGSAYPLDKQSRETDGLIYFCGSSELIYIDGRRYEILPDCVVYFRRGEKYRVEVTGEGISCYVINFFCRNPDGYIIQENCTDIKHMFIEAERIWRRHRDDEYYRLECISLAYHIMAEICRRRDHQLAPLRRRGQLDPVIEYIHENYSSPELKVAQLSGLIGVSERALCRNFAEVYGRSPKRYIAELRMKRAKELLSGSYTVGEIAGIVGFQSIYHFSSFFKTECGISPTEYRQRMIMRQFNDSYGQL